MSLKGVETQLKRIADALEVIVRQEYGWNMTAPVPIKSGDGKQEDEVDYANDEATFKRELEREVREIARDESHDELL